MGLWTADVVLLLLSSCGDRGLRRGHGCGPARGRDRERRGERRGGCEVSGEVSGEASGGASGDAGPSETMTPPPRALPRTEPGTSDAVARHASAVPASAAAAPPGAPPQPCEPSATAAAAEAAVPPFGPSATGAASAIIGGEVFCCASAERVGINPRRATFTPAGLGSADFMGSATKRDSPDAWREEDFAGFGGFSLLEPDKLSPTLAPPAVPREPLFRAPRCAPRCSHHRSVTPSSGGHHPLPSAARHAPPPSGTLTNPTTHHRCTAAPPAPATLLHPRQPPVLHPRQPPVLPPPPSHRPGRPPDPPPIFPQSSRSYGRSYSQLYCRFFYFQSSSQCSNDTRAPMAPPPLRARRRSQNRIRCHRPQPASAPATARLPTVAPARAHPMASAQTRHLRYVRAPTRPMRPPSIRTTSLSVGARGCRFVTRESSGCRPGSTRRFERFERLHSLDSSGTAIQVTDPPDVLIKTARLCCERSVARASLQCGESKYCTVSFREPRGLSLDC